MSTFYIFATPLSLSLRWTCICVWTLDEKNVFCKESLDEKKVFCYETLDGEGPFPVQLKLDTKKIEAQLANFSVSIFCLHQITFSKRLSYSQLSVTSCQEVSRPTEMRGQPSGGRPNKPIWVSSSIFQPSQTGNHKLFVSRFLSRLFLNMFSLENKVDQYNICLIANFWI